ncbi:hypothetical protein BMF90_04555 [Serratia sp. OLHL2]|uniref:LysR family transcriptional regulator n=1 Tax=Serratia TaxID=613 RepID=UPI000C19F588|nr:MULTISPECIES: LysR substrate-binding domain-containing protein [Serratia]PII54154.1 hypothetical protein BMF87_07865 [Serratia sp. OLEL1]PII62682.1 hypothetical protein BMF85_01115 [Serratia sp. OLCL1]PII63847.1 hypothetical protein BMF92_08800 [Serratia sp. OLBL1]PII66597.1 hypothetical protein BMF90_04555 [Serratia sp. OLHL2]PII71152.1 hypothetical protein BMF88_19120 [Serratia sp. OLDL1]
MRDLNALRTFFDVAKAQGYSAAHRETGQARATLSRHISTLEDELGTRLIERSSQSFRLTESGQLLFERCSDILGQLDEAVAMVEDRQREPRGLVRISVPPSILELYVGEAIQQYLAATPHVRIQIDVTNRDVDIRHEGFDFVIRGRSRFDYPLDFVRVPLLQVDRVIVAHPRWARAVKATLDETLQCIPTLAWSGIAGESRWEIADAGGKMREIAIRPLLIVDSMPMLCDAVLAGMGMTIIPRIYVEQEIATGRLITLEFGAALPPGVLHAVHLGHRGMRPAVRHLLDWLKDAAQKRGAYASQQKSL